MNVLWCLCVLVFSCCNGMPCVYKISEINCMSDFNPVVSWTHGQYYPFVELEAKCGIDITSTGISHNLSGFSLVFWNFSNACSSVVFPLDNPSSFVGRKHITIALLPGVMPLSEFQPLTNNLTWFPSSGYVGAVSLHRKTPFEICPGGQGSVKMDLSVIEVHHDFKFEYLLCGPLMTYLSDSVFRMV